MQYRIQASYHRHSPDNQVFDDRVDAIISHESTIRESLRAIAPRVKTEQSTRELISMIDMLTAGEENWTIDEEDGVILDIFGDFVWLIVPVFIEEEKDGGIEYKKTHIVRCLEKDIGEDLIEMEKKAYFLGLKYNVNKDDVLEAARRLYMANGGQLTTIEALLIIDTSLQVDSYVVPNHTPASASRALNDALRNILELNNCVKGE